MDHLCFLAFLLGVCATQTVRPTRDQLVTVTVPNLGEIVGRIQNGTLPDGQESIVAAFKGIPYAEPPIGDLRFAMPVPKVNLTSPFQALEFGPACPQKNDVPMSEDCLYLNIYVPYGKIKTFGPFSPIEPSAPMSGGFDEAEGANESELLPVLVWIHGGAFRSGQGTLDPSRIVTWGDIIVVTLNYRLGALGFLSTDDQQAPGNFGLWDQRLALLWVKNNIEAFGGDPSKVTLGGGSAGAYCVTYQALYPPNSGLFHRFISASGTAISAGSTQTKGGFYAHLLAEKLGCDTSSSSEIISCLGEKNVSDIIAIDVDDAHDPFELSWFPVVDGEFVKENPRDLIEWPPSDADLTFLKSLDAMFVTASAEGSVSFGIWVPPVAQKLNQSVDQGASEELFDKVVNDLLASEKETNSSLLRDAIMFEYRDWRETRAAEFCDGVGRLEGACKAPSNLTALSQSSAEDQDPTDTASSVQSSANEQEYTKPAALAQSLVNLLTDRHWFVPNVIFCRNHAFNNTQTKTYLMQFDLPDQVGIIYPWLRGAAHGQYNKYVWGLTGVAVNLSTDSGRKQWELSKAFMTFWSNFIKTGTTNGTSVNTEWLPFDLKDEHCLYMDPDVISSRMRCKAKRTAFWLDYFPKVKAATSLKVKATDNFDKEIPECHASSGQKSEVTVTVLLFVILSMLHRSILFLTQCIV